MAKITKTCGGISMMPCDRSPKSCRITIEAESDGYGRTLILSDQKRGVTIVVDQEDLAEIMREHARQLPAVTAKKNQLCHGCKYYGIASGHSQTGLTMCKYALYEDRLREEPISDYCSKFKARKVKK